MADLADEVERIVFAFSDTGRKDAIRALADRIRALESELAELRKREEWIPGNGSGLPDGTEAWVAWKAEAGYGVTWSYRRDGGWGSNGDADNYFEAPAFKDEPGLLGLHTPVAFYMLGRKPAPPPART